MTRTTILTAALLLGGLIPSTAAAGDHDWFDWGMGWTNRYGAMASCPGSDCRPWNPLLAVPWHSSLGQTGARRVLLFPPHIPSPLYNNTPGLFPIPPGSRPIDQCVGHHTFKCGIHHGGKCDCNCR